MQIAAPASSAAPGIASSPLAALPGLPAESFAAVFGAAGIGASPALSPASSQPADPAGSGASPAVDPAQVTLSSDVRERLVPVAPVPTGTALPLAGKTLPEPLQVAAAAVVRVAAPVLAAGSERSASSPVSVGQPGTLDREEDKIDPAPAAPSALFVPVTAPLIVALPQPGFGSVTAAAGANSATRTPAADPQARSALPTAPASQVQDPAAEAAQASQLSALSMPAPSSIAPRPGRIEPMPAVALTFEAPAPELPASTPAAQLRIATPLAAGLAPAVAAAAGDRPEAPTRSGRAQLRTAAVASAAAMPLSISPDPAPFQPLAPQSTVAAQPATAGAFAPVAAEPSRPMDIATLVDAIARARDEVAPRVVSVSLAHAEFGRVSLRFRQGEDSLDVSMTSADPGFARAVSAAPQPVAPVAAAREGAATGDAGRAPDGGQASAQQGGDNGHAQGGHAGGFRSGHAVSANRSHRSGTEATADDTDIFA